MDEFMTLPRLDAMFNHWNSFPPVHETVAAFVGFEPGERAAPAASSSGARPAATITNADIVRDMPVPRQAVKWQSVPNEQRGPYRSH